MKTVLIGRPWKPLRSYGWGVKNARSRIYQTSQWRNVIRPSFLEGTTEWQGQQVSNKLCIECYKQGTITPTHSVDHVVAIKDGGSPTDPANMQGLCLGCHNSKSAREGNARRKT